MKTCLREPMLIGMGLMRLSMRMVMAVNGLNMPIRQHGFTLWIMLIVLQLSCFC